VLAFTGVYFFESSLFNTLRPIQIKFFALQLLPPGLPHARGLNAGDPIDVAWIPDFRKQ
jgi:hypothetical protein